MTNNIQTTKVSNESLCDDFAKHIELPHNIRTLFSGRFGSGKSTFLNEFFEKKTEYLPVLIYPTNYSVSNNEDVFELIKYDILSHLINNYKDYIALDEEVFDELLFWGLTLPKGWNFCL